MLINVQNFRCEPNGDVVATVLDGQGGSKRLRLRGEDADRVARTWAQSKFDFDRYARLPPEFPTPASMPVEIGERPPADG